MIRDAHGRKMSKSLGNVIDPLEVIDGISLAGLHKRLDEGNLDPTELEVAKEGQAKDFSTGICECGADALWFLLISYTAQSDKINLDIDRVLDDYTPPAEIVPATLPFGCQWILSVLNNTISKTVSSLDSYEFLDAATAVYSWWKYQFCGIYIEAIKPYFTNNDPTLAFARSSAQGTLWVCLDNGLRLVHRFRLPSQKDFTRKESIMLCEYPSIIESWTNARIESEMNTVDTAVILLRKLKEKLPGKKRNERRAAFALCQTDEISDIIKLRELEISTLATLSSLMVLSKSDDAPAESTASDVNADLS
ncbi:hypothetical protein RJ639_027943, partial [Escallonia herrerae]